MAVRQTMRHLQSTGLDLDLLIEKKKRSRHSETRVLGSSSTDYGISLKPKPKQYTW